MENIRAKSKINLVTGLHCGGFMYAANLLGWAAWTWKKEMIRMLKSFLHRLPLLDYVVEHISERQISLYWILSTRWRGCYYYYMRHVISRITILKATSYVGLLTLIHIIDSTTQSLTQCFTHLLHTKARKRTLSRSFANWFLSTSVPLWVQFIVLNCSLTHSLTFLLSFWSLTLWLGGIFGAGRTDRVV